MIVRPGVEHEVGVGGVLHPGQRQALDHAAVALRAQVEHALAKFRPPQVGRTLQRAAHRLAAGQDVGVEIVGDAHAAHHGLRRIVRPGHVRTAAACACPAARSRVEAVDGMREGVHAVVDHAPQIEDEAVVAVGERGKAGQVFHQPHSARRCASLAHRVPHAWRSPRRAARQRVRASAAGSAPGRHRRTRCRAAPARRRRGSWPGLPPVATPPTPISASRPPPAGRHAPARRSRAGTAARRRQAAGLACERRAQPGRPGDGRVRDDQPLHALRDAGLDQGSQPGVGDRSGAIFTSSGGASRHPAATARRIARSRASPCRSRRPGVFGEETLITT